MKRWHKIALVVTVLLVLVANYIYHRVDNALDERQSYVHDLGLHFTAKVDSIETFSFGGGYVYFHTTSGALDLSAEDRAGKKLKFNGSLRFILDMDGKPAFHSRDLDNYKTGDSLVVNSDAGKIYVHRQANG